MPKKLLGTVIFRRIKGRIVPVKITSESGEPGERIFSAMLKRKRVGGLRLKVPKEKKSALVDFVAVDSKLRGKGIASALLEKAAKFSDRAGKKFLRSGGLIHPGAVKNRKNLPGKTKFVRRTLGASAQKIVTPEEAKRIAKTGGSEKLSEFVMSTTRIKGFRKRKIR